MSSLREEMDGHMGSNNPLNEPMQDVNESSSQVQPPMQTLKRKPMKNRSIVWNHFEKIKDDNDNYTAKYLGENGYPLAVDWVRVRKLSDLLKPFYDMTLRISGSSYVTSNTLFNEITEVYGLLSEWKVSHELLVKNLGLSMSLKFEKYWGDPQKMNNLIFWAHIYDPREKFEYIDYALGDIYGDEKGANISQNLMHELGEIFKEYQQMYQPQSESSASGISTLSITSGEHDDCDSFLLKKAKFKKLKMESGVGKTELDMYLGESCVTGGKIDLLKWWKANSDRLPVLSKMDRDMFAIPFSTVASESTFSTGGRILDDFRSSLTSKIVEALVCSQDWIRDSQNHKVEESLDELEKFEKDLSNVEKSC